MKRAEQDSMLAAEELRLRAQKRRRLVLIPVFVLLLGTLAFFAARPTRNAIKGWQARRHAAKAFSLIEEAKWNEARAEAVAAYQLRSTEPQALRAVARLLSRTRQQQALEFWDQLGKQEPLTRDDLRDQSSVAMVNGDWERAATATETLLANDGREATPQDWLLVTQLRLQQGEPEKALDSLGRLLGNSAATPREQFQASLLQLQSARTRDAEVNQRAQTEAWQRLNKFAQGDDAVGLDALVLLAQRQLAGSKAESEKLKTEISAEELVRRLEAHPLAKAPQKLLAIDLQLQAVPDEKESLVRRAIAEWKNAETPQLVVLATWLNGKGEFQRQLDEIPEEKALSSRDLFLQRMDALGALGRWEEIRGLLASDRFPLDQVMQRMYLARTNAQLGNEAAATNNWQRALEAAAGEAGKLMALAEYAEKNGASEIAESAYGQATTSAPKLRAARQGQLRMVYAKRETKQIHLILAEMLKLWPNDTAILNDEAYIRLLLIGGSRNDESRSPKSESDADDLVAIEKLAEELVRKEPASLPHRTLLALARLKQQRPVAALQVYDGIQVVPNALTPSALAVHAAVLAANGQREDARKEIAGVAINRLLPEEHAATADLREQP